MIEHSKYVSLEKADRELVFIGPLSEDRGLRELLASLQQIKRVYPSRIKVTFLGKEGHVGEFTGSEYIEQVLSGFSEEELDYRIDTSFGNPKDIIQYLSAKNGTRVAIIPSRLESFSFLTQQIAQNHLPLIASDSPATRELFEPQEGKFACLYNNSAVKHLSSKIFSILSFKGKCWILPCSAVTLIHIGNSIQVRVM
jgi:glycosyltransferase involved in cell wall biosynthesis